MNNVVLIGRLTNDPDVRYSTGETSMAIAKYTLAVDRDGKDKGTDFIRCVAFGKLGEFAEKYLSKGMKIAINGRIQTGSYDDKDGRKVYTTDVIVARQEFCERKADQAQESAPAQQEGFMSIPEGIDEELPFN